MNDESSKYRAAFEAQGAHAAVEGTIVNTRSNSVGGFHLEVEADVGFFVGQRVWFSRQAPAFQLKAATDAQVFAYVPVHPSSGPLWSETHPAGGGHNELPNYERIPLYTHPAPSQAVGAHPDDLAVDAFAAAMKEKLAQARAKGRGGWNNDEAGMQQRLSDMLRDHVNKGDPRDVANFAMFLHQRGEGILPEQAVATAGDGVTEEAVRRACELFDPIGWEHTGGDSRADFKASMRRVLEAASTPPSAPRVGVPDGWAHALDAAVAAIYFADSSDYETALWQVVKHLKPDLVDLLQSDESAAYEQVKAMLAAAPEVES